MRRNFGLLAGRPPQEKPATDPLPMGRVLPAWMKILPVIVIQGIVRHTNWVRPLNGTYATPFVDVLMEREIKHNVE